MQGLRATFDHEFQAICEDLVLMSQKVDWAIENSLKALMDGDMDLAESIRKKDEDVNQLRFKIEEACVVAIATQQPAAGDLRAVIAAMHIVTEMERMGDHAAGIAKTVILMHKTPGFKSIKKIPKMVEISRQMLQDSIQAFIKRDTNWAREIAAMDSQMDELYKDLFDRLIKIMAKKPQTIPRATYLMWTGHNLERIADRVTNIAEQVVFMTTGDLSELQA